MTIIVMLANSVECWQTQIHWWRRKLICIHEKFRSRSARKQKNKQKFNDSSNFWFSIFLLRLLTSTCAWLTSHVEGFCLFFVRILFFRSLSIFMLHFFASFFCRRFCHVFHAYQNRFLLCLADFIWSQSNENEKGDEKPWTKLLDMIVHIERSRTKASNVKDVRRA